MQKMTGGAVSLQTVYYQKDMREHRLVEEFYQLMMAERRFSEVQRELRECVELDKRRFVDREFKSLGILRELQG